MYVCITHQFLLGTHGDLWNTVCTCYTAVPSWYTWRSDWIIEVTWNTVCTCYTAVPSWYTWRSVKYRMYVLHSSSFLVYIAICELPYVRVTQQFLRGTHGDLWNTVCTCYTAVPSWYIWRSDWIIEVTDNCVNDIKCHRNTSNGITIENLLCHIYVIISHDIMC